MLHACVAALGVLFECVCVCVCVRLLIHVCLCGSIERCVCVRMWVNYSELMRVREYVHANLVLRLIEEVYLANLLYVFMSTVCRALRDACLICDGYIPAVPHMY